MTTNGTTRHCFLDWLRILAFGLLVVYHVGMYYVSWDWHVKSPHASAALVPWMLLSSPWRMDLLFLVSGAATGFMLARGGASGALIGQRAKRLLLPLVLGMLVIVPPQSYLEVVRRYGYGGGYVEFMGLYLTGGDASFCGPRGCLILPTWNHLWYLPYLMAYTLLLWGAVRAWPALPAYLGRRLAPGDRARGWLAVPIALLALSSWALRARYPVTHALVDDLYAHVQQLPIFVLGAAWAWAPRDVWTPIAALRWRALATAAGGWVVLAWIAPAIAGDAAPDAAAMAAGGASANAPAWAPGAIALVRTVSFATLQWAAIVAALGFARVHLERDGAARRYLTDAVFPVYVVHQTVIILLARALAPYGLAPAAEAALLAAATFAACLACYEAVRRVPALRPWFGLSGARRVASEAATPGNAPKALPSGIPYPRG